MSSSVRLNALIANLAIIAAPAVIEVIAKTNQIVLGCEQLLRFNAAVLGCSLFAVLLPETLPLCRAMVLWFVLLLACDYC